MKALESEFHNCFSVAGLPPCLTSSHHLVAAKATLFCSLARLFLLATLSGFPTCHSLQLSSNFRFLFRISLSSVKVQGSFLHLTSLSIILILLDAAYSSAQFRPLMNQSSS
jgi:hypothetical protein